MNIARRIKIFIDDLVSDLTEPEPGDDVYDTIDFRERGFTLEPNKNEEKGSK